MMRTIEPGFQIAEHAVDMRSDLMGSLGGMDPLAFDVCTPPGPADWRPSRSRASAETSRACRPVFALICARRDTSCC